MNKPFFPETDEDPDGFGAALRTCDRIQRFWAAAGYNVACTPVRRHVMGSASVWGVRSNLGRDGRPLNFRRPSDA